jgi:CBS domain-containing protein
MSSQTANGHAPAVADLPVEEVMRTAPDHIETSESTMMAWEMMRRGGYHHMPVVAPDGTYAGMVDTETLAATWPGGGPDHARREVADMLGSQHHPRVRAGDPVRAAAVAMLHCRTHAVAVVDDKDRLIGIVTSSDLLALLAGPPDRLSRSPLFSAVGTR